MDYLVYGEPVKGWSLIRALKDLENLNAGEWALVYSNLFFVKKNFLPSFFFKDIPDDFDEESDIGIFLNKIDEFEKSMNVDPQLGFAFYTSCLDDGFDPIKDDFFIFVAGRIKKIAEEGQQNITDNNLQKLMNIFVAMEQYERAALVRDKLEKKNINKIF